MAEQPIPPFNDLSTQSQLLLKEFAKETSPNESPFEFVKGLGIRLSLDTSRDKTGEDHLLSGAGNVVCDEVMKVVKKKELSILQCVSTSTDGASSMRGEGKGFLGAIRREGFSGIHIHCLVHKVQLSLLHVLQNRNHRPFRSAVKAVGRMATFLKASSKRRDMLKQFQKMKNNSVQSIPLIHKIRWTSTFRSVSHAIACFESAKSVMNVVGSQKKKHLYLKSVWTSRLMKRLILLRTVLSEINNLTIRLQTTDLNLFQALDATVECCERLFNRTHPGELLKQITDRPFGEARESFVILVNDTLSFADDLITNLRRDLFDGNHLDFYLLFGSLDRKRKPSKEAFLSLLERYKSAVSLIQLPTIKSEFHSFKEMIINSPVLFPLSTHHRVAVFLQSQTNQQLYPRIFTLTKIALLVQPTSVLPERGFSQTTRTKTPFRSHLSSEALAMQSVIVANSKPSLSEEELNTLFTQYCHKYPRPRYQPYSSYLGSACPTCPVLQDSKKEEDNLDKSTDDKN
ncbi:hypothetical protein BLNAU_19377 [Blattamonas nauphoetae]|uniref:HAT C-terminal dimerisation domain-containing protein n=1 Tax=Blattamonas nauphoetae TaxID=2049346 RepID=A0ABQ9X274_9EUKA|nr:hypothetical protein BLNAU_19377 [Blattamonas nauphoetae]